MMITLPVKRAGASLPVARRRGKFHGTMAPTTPIGVYRVMMVRFSLSSTTSSGMLMLDMPRIHSIAQSVS